MSNRYGQRYPRLRQEPKSDKTACACTIRNRQSAERVFLSRLKDDYVPRIENFYAKDIRVRIRCKKTKVFK